MSAPSGCVAAGPDDGDFWREVLAHGLGHVASRRREDFQLLSPSIDLSRLIFAIEAARIEHIGIKGSIAMSTVRRSRWRPASTMSTFTEWAPQSVDLEMPVFAVTAYTVPAFKSSRTTFSTWVTPGGVIC